MEMPPLVIAALALAGVMAAARFLVRESRRVTLVIDPHRAPPTPREDRGVRLVRDPRTGTYKPHARV